MVLVKLNDTSTGWRIRQQLDEIANGVEDILPHDSVELTGSYSPAAGAAPVGYSIIVNVWDRSVTVLTSEDEDLNEPSPRLLAKAQSLAEDAVARDWQSLSSRLRQYYWPSGPRWRSSRPGSETLKQPLYLGAVSGV